MEPLFPALLEANIIATGGNSAGTEWDNTHTGLIDNEGLGGTYAEVHSYSKCAVSERGSGKNPLLYMKLDAPKNVLKLQLAARTGGWEDQGQNVRVQVGPSSEYDANYPVCTEIGQVEGTGSLEDYECGQVHRGQYVFLSNDQRYISICEAKVFVEAGMLLFWWWLSW